MQPRLPSPTELFERSWRDFSEHLGPMLGAVLIGIGIFIAFYIVLVAAMFGLMFLLRGNQVWFQILNNAVTGVFTVVFLWGYIGYARFNLEIIRGAEPNLMTLFNQWRLIPNYFLTNSLVTQLMFLALIPFTALAAGPVAALWDPNNPFPAIGVGAVAYLILIVALVPLSAGTMMAAMFTIDRELDPVAAIMAGLRAVPGNIGWIYQAFLFLFAVGIGTSFLACTGVGALVAIPFTTLLILHCYLALADRLEAQLAGEKADPSAVVAPEPEVADPADPADSAEKAEVGSPVEDEGANPYAPPSAKVEGPTLASQRLETPLGRPAPQALPKDARCYRPAAPASVTMIAIGCLIPWVMAGGNPFSGAMVGYMVARPLGIPSWAGAVAGFGGLTLCGIAAIVVLVLGYRGRRDAVVDEAGLVVDGNRFWTGLRLRWDELRGFRISPRGVEIYLRGGWGWIWRPVVPTRERETHDLVEKLEGHGVMRLGA
jgi:hypothetical protein